MANGEDHSSANHTSILMEEKSDILNTLKATMSAKLRPDSPMFPTSCIFRVPQLLRRHNEEAYQPFIVSIGPLHRGGEQFQSIEIVKQWYLYNLLSSMNISLQIFIDRIDKFLEQRKEGIIDRFEQHARSFYAEPLHHINRNDFIEMMILDGCFLIQLFRNFIHGEIKKGKILKWYPNHYEMHFLVPTNFQGV
ncbi:hypothetical protein RchiOBHm_Chr4g0411041 [Rosa chinensis]|uniref:Uncharacterized protein n=1 Tax=Rosa chinensis TaxID=74649 RepID=A0A2P6QVK0_ROSCH|nr:hypothetical protein RchiOBHm_Chr4g0411041 [Rosa chinensis]